MSDIFRRLINFNNSQTNQSVAVIGDIVHVAENVNGISAYRFNGETLELIANRDDGGVYYGIITDGTYLHVCRDTDGLSCYTFDGVSYTLEDTDDQGGVYRYATFYGTDLNTIFVHADTIIVAYTFLNGTYTFKDTQVSTVNAYESIASDGTYVYYSEGTQNLGAASWDGTNITEITTENLGSNQRVNAVTSVGNYICCRNHDAGGNNDNWNTFTFDGANFTSVSTTSISGQKAAVASAQSFVDAQERILVGGTIGVGGQDFFKYYEVNSQGVVSELFSNDEDNNVGRSEESGNYVFVPTQGFISVWLWITANFSFTGSTKAPTTIAFTNNSVIPDRTLVLYTWDFGDGTTSNEINPEHIYYMPGNYTVILTLEIGGLTTTNTQVIRIYDYDYVSGGTHVAYTNKSYRHAIKGFQGVGTTEYNGTYWLYPTAYTGTARGYDNDGNQLSLVCDNNNGKFYRIGINDLWEDRNSQIYSGYNIPTSWKFKERTAVAGEFEQIQHIESHLYFRPYYEDNRSQYGYDENGFLTNHSVNLKVYKDGEPTTESGRLENVPQYGDYVFRNRVEARRLQIEAETDTSAWRCIKAQELYAYINKKAAPAVDRPQEDDWQYEFNNPVFWMSRDRLRPGLNRATGTSFGGSYASLYTGPDSTNSSAVDFLVGDGFTATISQMSGDFTVSVWIDGIATFPITLWQMDEGGGGTLNIQLVQNAGSRFLVFDDGTNYVSRPLSYTGTGWVMLTVERSDTNLLMFENASQLTATPLVNSTLTYGGTVVLNDGDICTMFDARIVERAVSSNALDYYYRDVTTNNGNGGLLPRIR